MTNSWITMRPLAKGAPIRLLSDLAPAHNAHSDRLPPNGWDPERFVIARDLPIDHLMAVDDIEPSPFSVGSVSVVGQQSVDNKRVCLEAAIKAVTGDRALNYGRPEDNFDRIAQLWHAYFAIRQTTKGTAPVDAADIALLMALMKIARLAYANDHADSWVDLAGYAACGFDLTRKP